MAVTLHLLLGIVIMTTSVDAGDRYMEDDRMSYWQQMLNSARRDSLYRDTLYRDAPYRDEILQRRESLKDKLTPLKLNIDAEHEKCMSKCTFDCDKYDDLEEMEKCILAYDECSYSCKEEAYVACSVQLCKPMTTDVQKLSCHTCCNHWNRMAKSYGYTKTCNALDALN